MLLTPWTARLPSLIFEGLSQPSKYLSIHTKLQQNCLLTVTFYSPRMVLRKATGNAHISSCHHPPYLKTKQQLWHADNAAAIADLWVWWDHLIRDSPDFGYFPTPAKTWFIIKEGCHSAVHSIFADTWVNVTLDGSRFTWVHQALCGVKGQLLAIWSVQPKQILNVMQVIQFSHTVFWASGPTWVIQSKTHQPPEPTSSHTSN